VDQDAISVQRHQQHDYRCGGTGASQVNSAFHSLSMGISAAGHNLCPL